MRKFQIQSYQIEKFLIKMKQTSQQQKLQLSLGDLNLKSARFLESSKDLRLSTTRLQESTRLLSTKNLTTRSKLASDALQRLSLKKLTFDEIQKKEIDRKIQTTRNLSELPVVATGKNISFKPTQPNRMRIESQRYAFEQYNSEQKSKKLMHLMSRRNRLSMKDQKESAKELNQYLKDAKQMAYFLHNNQKVRVSCQAKTQIDDVNQQLMVNTATSALSGGPKNQEYIKNQKNVGLGQIMAIEQDQENTTQYLESPRRQHTQNSQQDEKKTIQPTQNIPNMQFARMNKDFDIQIIDDAYPKEMAFRQDKFTTEKSPNDSVSALSPRMISQGPRYNQILGSQGSQIINQNMSLRTNTAINISKANRNQLRQQTQHTAQNAILKNGRTSQEFEVKEKKERQKSSYVQRQNLLVRQTVQRKKTGNLFSQNKSKVMNLTKTHEYHIEGSETSYTKKEGFSNGNGAETQNAEPDEVGSDKNQQIQDFSLNPSQLNSNLQHYSALNQSSSRQSYQRNIIAEGKQNGVSNLLKEEALSSQNQELEGLQDKDPQIV